MKKVPKVRCPVCGHIVFFRNVALGLHHRIETFVLHIRGLGRGKGFENVYESQYPEGIEDFWIRRLEGVIKWLKANRRISLKIPVEQTSLRKVDRISSNVSGISVLPQKAKLLLKSTKTKTLRVPSSVPTMSLQVMKSSLKSVKK